MSGDTLSNEPDKQGKRTKGVGFFSELRRRKVYRVAITYLVVGWIIVQIANSTFEGFGIPAWAFRFIVLMLMLGFPVAIILAWAFELTPDGIRTTRAARDEQDESEYHRDHHRKRNWISYAIGALLPTFIFGSLALFFFFRTPAPELSDKSIAVLPFDNRSKLEEDEYFTEGIHDDLLTQISMIKDIKTISRTSVMVYKDSPKNLKTIGEELGVTTILEGGVQRSGNMIRINAQLIDAATDVHLWAKTYDRELTAENVFRIQTEIALTIADALKAVLSPEEKEDLNRLPTQNLEALEAYFKGTRSFDATDIKDNIKHLENAIRLDPEFADAYAALAGAILYQSKILRYSRKELIPKVEPLLERALELDPRNSIAHSTIGWMNLVKRDYGEAEEAFSKAIKYDPANSSAYAHYGMGLISLNAPDRALDIILRGLEVDPHNQDLKEKQINCLLALGNDTEARVLMDEYYMEYPDEPTPKEFRKVYERQGEIAKAIRITRRLYYEDPANSIHAEELERYYRQIGDEENESFWLVRSLELTTDPKVNIRWRLYSLIAQEKWQEAESLFKREVNQSNASRLGTILWNWMLIDFEQGRMKAPMARYEHLFPDIFREGYEIRGKRLKWIEKDCAITLRAAGENKRASALFAKLISDREKALDKTLLVMLYSLTGDLDSAMKIIRERDPLIYARLYHNYNYINLQGYPEYEAYIKETVLKLEKQRKLLAEWEANGELAPIPPVPVK